MNKTKPTYQELENQITELKRQHEILQLAFTSHKKEKQDNEEELIKSIKKVEVSEKRFKLLYENTPLSYQSLDTSTRIIDVNPAWLITLGYKREEVIGHHFGEFMTPESEKLIEARFPEFVKNGEIHNYEFEMVRKDGIHFMVSYQGKIGYDEFGQFHHTHCVFTDISERIKAENLLKISENRFTQIAESSGDWIWEVDTNGLYTYVSTLSNTLLGYDPKEMIGKKYFYDFFDIEDKEELKNAAFKVFANKKSFNFFENTVIHKDGHEIILETKGFPILDVDGELLGYRGVDKDVSERKQFEAELIKAKNKAEESDRLKSSFLANMSHEIRTPMSGILGFSELLEQPNLTDEKQKKYIDIIRKSGMRMLNIINDIVSISKIEAGLMEVYLKQSNINELIVYIFNFFKPEIEKKGMKLSFKNTLNLDKSIIITDYEKVYAILTNLVKNAIKYTENGAIEFGCNKKGDFLEFYVKDTGIGIPKSRQKAIFERFIQADIADKNAYQGAGLGLSISKSFVTMLGGSIWVESEEERGSIFYFTLPYTIETINENDSKDELLTLEIETMAKNLKLLIAEDDKASEIFLTIVSEEFSDEIIVVRTGKEAVEACRNNPDIDVVLMDIQMPEMNGYEATREIRKFNKDVIIIAQTAFALEGDEEKTIKCGCNDYIIKPFKPIELEQIIIKNLKK